MPPEARLGTVKLVGAGPGAADLLTLRAARAIGSAQALLYDALISEEVLALAPAACLKIQTGKRAGRTSMKQETINRLMLRLAQRGLVVGGFCGFALGGGLRGRTQKAQKLRRSRKREYQNCLKMP